MPFRQHFQAPLTATHRLSWWFCGRGIEIYAMEGHMLAVGWRCGFNGLFSSLFFLSSPCQNTKVSFHLFFISNLFLILLITICFYFFINYFLNLVPYLLVSFNFYIKFGPYFFNCYLFIFYCFSS